MNATLIRSAYTWIIYELKDCSVALLDAEHRVLGQSPGLPIFLGNLEVCTRVTEEMYGREAWQPGDVWIMNDSYLAGTHLNDITVYGPIFHDGELVGFAASRAHWLDVGAKDAGAPMDSTEIYQEGMRLGPTKVVEGGRERRDVIDLLGRNSRFSYPAVGDLNAQIACARTGERRLSALIERFGAETLAAARDEIFAQTERLERDRDRRDPGRRLRGRGRARQRRPLRHAGRGPRADRDQRRRHDDRPHAAPTTQPRARSTAARRRRSRPAASPTSCSSHPTCRRTAARSRRSR